MNTISVYLWFFYLCIHYNWKLIPTAMGTTCPFSSCTNLSDALHPVQCPGTINCGSNSLKHSTVSSIMAKAKCISFYSLAYHWIIALIFSHKYLCVYLHWIIQTDAILLWLHRLVPRARIHVLHPLKHLWFQHENKPKI